MRKPNSFHNFIAFVAMVLFCLYILSSCGVKVVSHNYHKKPKGKNKGFYSTPYGVYHKSILTKPNQKYEKVSKN